MGCPNEGPHVTPYKMQKWGSKIANLEQNDIFLNNKTKGNTLDIHFRIYHGIVQ